MNKRTEALLAKIDQAHDWDEGQVWGGGGTRLSSTDECRVCGLTRGWFSDSQNGVKDRFDFVTASGDRIPLRQAAELEC